MGTIEIKDPLFYDSKGQLTKYSFACGYVEAIRNTTHWKELYQEHSYYHVRTGEVGKQFSEWVSFESNRLGSARKLYNSIKL